MRRVALILASLACWGASTAIAAPNVPAGAIVTRPDWQVVPNGDDLADQYPALAQFVGIGGRALLHCVVAIDGSMKSCAVSEETPAGLGFGEAALAFSKTFKMKPMTVNG
ncbi:MAG TPA: TonB family protein, partial [Caulobacteraceae bacterium]|nr:TonB family protein [Caulobacteraceae bacterium]